MNKTKILFYKIFLVIIIIVNIGLVIKTICEEKIDHSTHKH